MYLLFLNLSSFQRNSVGERKGETKTICKRTDFTTYLLLYLALSRAKLFKESDTLLGLSGACISLPHGVASITGSFITAVHNNKVFVGGITVNGHETLLEVCQI